MKFERVQQLKLWLGPYLDIVLILDITREKAIKMKAIFSLYKDSKAASCTK